MLRAREPSRPRVEEDGGQPRQGQDLPAQDRHQAVQRLHADLRVDYRARRADSHVLRTRLRLRRRRGCSGLRSKHGAAQGL